MALITFGQLDNRPYCTLEVVQVSQDYTENTSLVRFTLTLKRPYQVSSVGTKTWTVTVNGETYTGTGSIAGIGDKVLLSGTQVIPHNADGSKTLTFSASCELNITWNGVPLGTISGSGSMALSTIPKYATVTQSMTGKTETTITMNWSSDAVVDYLWYSYNNGASWNAIDIGDGTKGSYTIGNLASNTEYTVITRLRRKDSQLTSDSEPLTVATYSFPYATSMPDFVIGAPLTLGIFNPLNRSVVVTLLAQNNVVCASDVINSQYITGYTGELVTDRLYSSIPNTQSGTYKVKVTYGTYEDTKDGGLYIVNPSNCSPEISAGAYADSNNLTIDLTGNNQDIVQHHSIVNYSASGLNSRKHATLISCQVVVNGQTYNLTINGTNASGNGGRIESATDVDAVFIVTDSRGLQTKKTVNVHMLEWYVPKALIDLHRQDNYKANTDLTVNASFASINGNNQLRIEVQYTQTSGSASYNFVIVQNNETNTFTLDVNTGWQFIISLYDSLGGSSTYYVYIPKGTPLVFYDKLKDSVGVNQYPEHTDSLEVTGTIYINGTSLDDYIRNIVQQI